MKILIITESIPFPPLNGRELPVAGIFEQLSIRHTVHLLVIENNSRNSKDLSRIPESIQFLGYLPAKKWSNKKRIIKTILSLRYLLSPFYYTEEDVRKIISHHVYDFIWISPVLYYGLIIFCRQHNLHFFKKAAIGLNDAKTWLYRDLGSEMILTCTFNKSYFSRWLLSFFLEAEEKKYLALVDLVHVQTQHEQNKLEHLMSPSSHAKIIAAANGIKEELFSCTYKGIDSDKILFMTQLDGSRAEESKWFIKKVWSIIENSLPDARLLLVGKPPKKTISFVVKKKNIIINGYAENLLEIFDSVRLAVVPTFHSTGLINRILDALTAGLPIVSTPQAIATFPDIKINEQILSAVTPVAFADAVIRLYNNKEYRETISTEARQYALKFPTWKKTAEEIENAMKKLM